MKFSDFFVSKDHTQLDKRTLVILRWMAIIGQLITISIVYFVFNFNFPFYFCTGAILVGAITNFYLQFYIKKNQLNNFSSTFFLYAKPSTSILLLLIGLPMLFSASPTF